jgi:GH25 family lysozyme M1 (1,4-beta-N-acetylmuramidase)
MVFSEVEEVEEAMGNALLADISSWQPAQINWSAYVAWSRSGDSIARVIMRASQGVGVPDQHFEAYWKGALAAGVEVIGVYHYAYPNVQPGAAGAIAEANYLHRVVGNRLRPQDFLMLDYEENVAQATADWALAFLQQTEQNFGKLPRIYSYQSFIASKLQDARLARYPLVYARWTFDPNSRPPAPHPWTSYEFLQYTDKGSVPGISGNVDVNVFIEGSNNMGIPAGWHDDGATLLAPNGVAVVKGFREWVLTHPWDSTDLPLAVERTLPSIEPGNPSIGAGSRQDFRMTSLGWTPSRGVYKIWVGQDILALEAQVAQLQAELKAPPVDVAALKADVAAIQALLTPLEAQVQPLQAAEQAAQDIQKKLGS